MDKENTKLLGAFLKGNRLKKKLTQNALSKGICSVSYLSKLENGYLIPDQWVLENLLNKLDVNIDLFNEMESKNVEILSQLNTWYQNMEYNDKTGITKSFEKIIKLKPIIKNTIYYNRFQLFYCKYLIDQGFHSDAGNEIMKIENIYKQLTSIDKFFFLYIKGKLCCCEDNFEKSLTFLLEAKKININPNLCSDLYYQIAIVYSKLQNITLSIEYGVKAINLFDETSNFNRSIDCKILLAINYARAGEIHKSILYFKNLLNTAKRINNYDLINKATYYLGAIYMKMQLYNDAVCILEESIISNNKKDEIYYDTLSLLAEGYLLLNDVKKSKKILGINEKTLGELPTKQYLKINILKISIRYGNVSRQLVTFLEDQAMPFFKKTNNYSLIEKYSLILIRYYKIKKQYKKVSELYDILYKYINKSDIDMI
ncbi:helix-turn-helix domain-containing protein [Cytobacillus firmus]|uniref:helix-turn-helix domain-containing protein n=1 Tax=Cytobacillus firmus TaxID=1399 RepID=UPI0018CE5E25|nr:helix-turn-helix transcriptional regulator [Cytobacillus firmus]MBG9587276.1 hypothetical protein [Cytobacillus firmus]